jgi:hypothetical protein
MLYRTWRPGTIVADRTAVVLALTVEKDHRRRGDLELGLKRGDGHANLGQLVGFELLMPCARPASISA